MLTSLAAVGRRRRSILYGTDGSGTVVESVLAELATELKAAFRVSASLEELSLWADRESEFVCLIVLQARLPDLVEAARAVSKRAPLSGLILLASVEEQVKLTQQLGVAPRLGSHWQFMEEDASGLLRALRSIYQRADQRRTTRTTLDRFNARLSAPSEAVDSGELRQLVISDSFLSSILESAFDSVILIDPSGMIAAFNPSAEKLFGRSQQEVLSHSIGSLSEGRWMTDTRRLLEPRRGGEILHTLLEVESGTKHVEISATPVYDRSENRLATSLIIRDITERHLSEQALRTNEKLAAVGRLASSIAHEINNPLEAVTNLLYLARRSVETTEIHEYLDTADQELRRMAAITNQTLGFHKNAADPKRVQAEDLFKSVVAVYGPRFINSRVVVESEFEARTPISCLEGEIRQVLNNLVGNSLDAMHATGGRLLIRSRDAVGWKTGVRGVVLTVADTGSGMNSRTMKKLFDAFYTTKGLGGTGLGLWISAEIVARHHGSLRVRSSQKEGSRGTVFRLFLPSGM